MPERHEEKYVRELLGARFNAVLRKLPESPAPGVKTPDYELLMGADRAAVLEVKRLRRMPRTAENGWNVAERDGVIHAERKDNAPARVGRAIHEAFKQLRAYTDPKILVFVNDESLIDVQDLEEAFQGFLQYGNDEVRYVNTASARIGDGNIRDERKLIDLYIWIDRLRPTEPIFRFTTEAGLDVARRFFS